MKIGSVSSKIRWRRIVLAALILESLYVIFILFILGAADYAFTWTGISAVFVFMAFGGFWVGSKASAYRTLQGSLVGAVAVLFYTLLTIPAFFMGEMAVTGLLLLNHLAKVLGGLAGGVTAQWKSRLRR